MAHFHLIPFFLLFSPTGHPSPKHTNLCIFLFGENEVGSGVGISLLRTRGMKVQAFISCCLKEDHPPPKKDAAVDVAQKKLERSSPKAGPAVTPVGESPGCASEFFRNRISVFIGSGISLPRASNATFTRVS